jgi:type II secretion system protein G
MPSKSNKRKGFTLIELLVVISIISLLSAIVVTALGNVKGRARDAVRKSDLIQIKKALELYNLETGSFPTGIACIGLNDAQTCWVGAVGSTALVNILKTYMPRIPQDPKPSRAIGGSYIYMNRLPTWHCSGTLYPYPADPYLVWLPDNAPVSGDDSQCQGMGFYSCCDWDCSNSYYCVYPVK